MLGIVDESHAARKRRWSTNGSQANYPVNGLS
jgi:hypothetical protein